MALRGLTGPSKFLGGIYGYAALYGRGRMDPEQVVAGLGEEWRLNRMMFKHYPSCGATQGLTALTLELVAAHGLMAGAQGRSATATVLEPLGQSSLQARLETARRCPVQRGMVRRQRYRAPKFAT